MAKLGIREGDRIAVVDPPSDYAKLVGGLPAGARIVAASEKGVGFVHLFVTARARLEKELGHWRKRIEQNGMLWVSWPKRASKVPTDLSEDVVREVALPLGFVDVKVCAVDDTWSGLKLVIRKELRTA